MSALLEKSVQGEQVRKEQGGRWCNKELGILGRLELCCVAPSPSTRETAGERQRRDEGVS